MARVVDVSYTTALLALTASTSDGYSDVYAYDWVLEVPAGATQAIVFMFWQTPDPFWGEVVPPHAGESNWFLDMWYRNLVDHTEPFASSGWLPVSPEPIQQLDAYGGGSYAGTDDVPLIMGNNVPGSTRQICAAHMSVFPGATMHIWPKMILTPLTLGDFFDHEPVFGIVTNRNDPDDYPTPGVYPPDMLAASDPAFLGWWENIQVGLGAIYLSEVDTVELVATTRPYAGSPGEYTSLHDDVYVGPFDSSWANFKITDTPDNRGDLLVSLAAAFAGDMHRGPYFEPLPVSDLPPLYVVGSPEGLEVEGNIDLNHRPVHHNPDGTISTVLSISFDEDGFEVIIPTVADDGGLWTDEEALDNYTTTGHHLGKFDNPTDADTYAIALHDQQEEVYGAHGTVLHVGTLGPPATAYVEERRAAGSGILEVIPTWNPGEDVWQDMFTFAGAAYLWHVHNAPATGASQVSKFRHKQRDDEFRTGGLPRNHPTSAQTGKRHGRAVYR